VTLRAHHQPAHHVGAWATAALACGRKSSGTMGGVGDLLRHGPGSSCGSWETELTWWLEQPQLGLRWQTLLGCRAQRCSRPGRFERAQYVRASVPVQPGQRSRHPSVSALLEPFRRRAACGAFTAERCARHHASLDLMERLRGRPNAILRPWLRPSAADGLELIPRTRCPVCVTPAARLIGPASCSTAPVISASYGDMLGCRIGGPQPAWNSVRRRQVIGSSAHPSMCLPSPEDHPGCVWCSRGGFETQRRHRLAGPSGRAGSGLTKLGSCLWRIVRNPPGDGAFAGKLRKACQGSWPLATSVRWMGKRGAGADCQTLPRGGGHGFRAGGLLEGCVLRAASWSGARAGGTAYTRAARRRKRCGPGPDRAGVSSRLRSGNGVPWRVLPRSCACAALPTALEPISLQASSLGNPGKASLASPPAICNQRRVLRAWTAQQDCPSFGVPARRSGAGGTDVSCGRGPRRLRHYRQRDGSASRPGALKRWRSCTESACPSSDPGRTGSAGH